MSYKVTINQSETVWVRKKWLRFNNCPHKHLYYDIFHKEGSLWKKWELSEDRGLFFADMDDHKVMALWFLNRGWKMATVTPPKIGRTFPFYGEVTP